MNTETRTVVLSPSLEALYACQNAWEKYKFFFMVTSPSFYAGWREEAFCRESTTDHAILKRMDALEEVVKPKRYILFHEPAPKVPSKTPVTLPKWVLPAGMAVVLVGSVWMLTTVAALGAVLMAPVAMVALDPSVVAELPDGTWVEIGWWND